MTMQASGLIKFSDIMSEIDSDEEPFKLALANSGLYETINITNINSNKPKFFKLKTPFLKEPTPGKITFFAFELTPKADSLAESLMTFFNFFIVDLPGS